MPQNSRYIIGIDLGTTNSSVAYVDTERGRDVRQLRIPQLLRAGELGERALLPSACYLPGSQELPAGALELPWDTSPGHAVGTFASEQGALVPGRLVTSAKSWMAHGGVDRNAGILPWGGDLGDAAVSPVEVSRHYLQHVRSAWDHLFGEQRDREGTRCVLSEQQVVVTVPASFDEVARELTVKAARQAGIVNLVLLEEPLAAFYGWLWRHEGDWQSQLAEGETVLVVDVGGGTTDFSLIRIEPGYILRRTAVGEHLLLGGDNIDMALARDVEGGWGVKLPPREWSLLCHQCRLAKEKLLAPGAPAATRLGIASAGSSVVARTRSAEVSRDHLLELLLDGFFPVLDVVAALPARRTGIRQMGLPYVADPAVTRHLLAFLLQAGSKRAVAPDRILFNGGTMLPDILRQRIRETVGRWSSGAAVPEIPADDLSLAVSCGAAYYGLVRRG